MFENFKTIKIKGGCFGSETELELFKKDALSDAYYLTMYLYSWWKFRFPCGGSIRDIQ